MNKEDHYIKTLNDALEREEFYFLDSIFSEYSELPPNKAVVFLNRTFQSDLFKKNIITLAHNFINYWKQINNHFNDFSEPNQELILTSIKNIQTWNRAIEIEIIGICKKASSTLNDEDKILFYEKYLTFILNKDFLIKEFDEADLYCLWFIYQLKKDKSIYTNNQFEETFDFSIELFNRLMDEVTNLQKHKLYHDFNYLMKFTPVNLIYFVLANGLFKYQGHSNFPKQFYENKMIQRVLINIDLESKLPQDILDNVIANIDYNFKFYGVEMNKFVRKHQIDNATNENLFVNGIGPGVVSQVKQLPFVPISVLNNNEQVDVLINLLMDTLNKKSEYTDNIFNEISKEGQIKEILKIFNTTDNWTTYPEFASSFLYKLISSDDLRDSYQQVIIEMIDYSLLNHYADDHNAIKYLEFQNYRNSNELNYLDSKLLSTIVEYARDDSSHPVYSIIFNDISPKELSTNSIFLNSEKQNSFIDLNDFINTSLGRYYSVVDKVPENLIINYFLNEFNNGIEDCVPEFRDYLKGKFYKFFKTKPEELNNINSFVGFSHNYKLGLKSEENALFSAAVKRIFISDISDNFIIDNLVSVLVTEVDPFKENYNENLSNPNYKNRLFMSMLELYFSTDIVSDPYLLAWIRWYIEIGNSIHTYVRHLIFYLIDLPTSKINTLLNYLDTYGQSGGGKIEDYEFSYIHSIDEFSKEKFEKFIQLISILLQKGYVNINYPFVSGLDDILDQLSKRNYINLIEELITIVEPHFLPSDIQRFEQKYFSKDSKK